MNDDTKVPKTRSTGLSRRKWLSGAAGAAAAAAVLPSRAPSLAAAPAFIRSRAMADVQLSVGLSGNVRLRPIVDGLVKPQGIDLTVTTSGVSELFWRQLHFAEFDVSEMSNSSYIITVANGDTRFVAIPVFPSRRFFHTEITVREGSGISRPEDLRGKRVGVPEFQQTAALWARFGLEHQFGVTARDMDWHMERPPGEQPWRRHRFRAARRRRFSIYPRRRQHRIDACVRHARRRVSDLPGRRGPRAAGVVSRSAGRNGALLSGDRLFSLQPLHRDQAGYCRTTPMGGDEPVQRFSGSEKPGSSADSRTRGGLFRAGPPAQSAAGGSSSPILICTASSRTGSCWKR